MMGLFRPFSPPLPSPPLFLAKDQARKAFVAMSNEVEEGQLDFDELSGHGGSKEIETSRFEFLLLELVNSFPFLAHSIRKSV
jgi:hypothetical protein